MSKKKIINMLAILSLNDFVNFPPPVECMYSKSVILRQAQYNTF